MRKYFLILLFVFLLAVPFTASADIITDVPLNLRFSNTTGYVTFPETAQGRYYLDYELYETTTDYLDSNEVFCVENAPGIIGISNYTLISFDVISDSLRPKYQAAANIAEAYYDSNNKAAAQVAIWETIFDYGTADLSDDSFKSSYQTSVVASILNNQYDNTSNWWLAVSPSLSNTNIFTSADEGVPGQNYLVRVAAPVPEPATMLLLGAGLVGLAGFGRKRLMK